MPRKWARKCERYCCLGATYFPIAFVYSVTTWGVWVEATIGFLPTKTAWIGNGTSLLGITLYILLNWSYTTAVFTSPGTTLKTNGYSSLPTHITPQSTAFTVKSNGELRYCKKCQARKPDRAHHCSTCGACVLKMDHHCPWLATCVGLRNYKAFLLFLIYLTLFCFVCFWVSGVWVWREILSEGEYSDSLMPVNYVMLAVISGIIGLVLAGFTGWHILLASRGQTTIECLEKTRYLSPARKAMREQRGSGIGGPEYGREYVGQSANTSEQTHESYDALERQRARVRYEEYLDEQDSEKLPSAFNLGWRKNLLHLFGPKKSLWALPICNTTGDGWNWEPSPKWLQAREDIRREREEQAKREQAAGWGEPLDGGRGEVEVPVKMDGAGRHYVEYPKRVPSKADRILGRSPDDYTDETGVSMENLKPRGKNDPYADISSDEGENEEADEEEDKEGIWGEERKGHKHQASWPYRVHKVGVVTNTLLGNTLARQKDPGDAKKWDDRVDDAVD